MSFTERELWTAIHGMGLGAIFLLAFAGGMAGLYSLRPEWTTPEGIRERMRRLVWGTWIMAAAAWFAVISGTYKVYPGYRAPPPEGADLTQYPRSFLLSEESMAAWHIFGMEWKEHVSWMAPILATVIAYLATRYRESLATNDTLRKQMMIVFSLAFLVAAVGGVFGAFITKMAPLT